MKKLYRFSHSVASGGFIYAHKVEMGIINNKEGLRNALLTIAKKLKLLDPTIKVYETIFFVFFFPRPTLSEACIIDTIQKNIVGFGKWSHDYVYATLSSIEEEDIRKELTRFGFDYDKG